MVRVQLPANANLAGKSAQVELTGQMFYPEAIAGTDLHNGNGFTNKHSTFSHRFPVTFAEKQPEEPETDTVHWMPEKLETSPWVPEALKDKSTYPAWMGGSDE